jgi:cellobiose dehydrogenase (acceptor)
MMRSTLSLLAMAAGAITQTTSAYVDANTGISFQRYGDTTGFGVGMALPETVGKDFIGQMVQQHVRGVND